MFHRISTRHATIAITATTLLLSACSKEDEGNERWVTTANTNVPIDWDKVNEAYKAAEGPEDLERRINEIYEGDELVSISIQDQDDTTQVVTGFFDKNASGQVDEGEAIFTVQRVIKGEGNADYQIQGHGYYAGYHSPMYGLMTGMLMGAMLSNAFSPGYRSQPYTTSTARRSAMSSQRSAYRSQNPTKYQSAKSSSTGRQYGSKGSSGATRSSTRRSGGSFGVRKRRRDGDEGDAAPPQKIRLTA